MSERINVKGHYRIVTRDSKGRFTSVRKWQGSKKSQKGEQTESEPFFMDPLRSDLESRSEKEARDEEEEEEMAEKMRSPEETRAA